jgi:hypothetical protein
MRSAADFSVDGRRKVMATHFGGWKRVVADTGAPREIQGPVRFAIEVCGLDGGGRFFTERSEALATGEVDCKFRLKTEVALEAILAVRIVYEGRRGGEAPAPILFRAVRREREALGWTIEARKLQHEEPQFENWSAVR